MKKFGAIDVVLIVLIAVGIAANVFVYGFYNKDDSGGDPTASGNPSVSAESPPAAADRPAQVENTPPLNATEQPADTPEDTTDDTREDTREDTLGNTTDDTREDVPTTMPPESVVNTLVFQLDNPNVTVNGQELAIDSLGSAPSYQNGASMLPLRATYELLGGSIGFDAGTGYISASFLDTSLRVKTGETGAEVNGAFVALTAAPISKDGTLYVPSRAIADALGAKLTWDAGTQTTTLEIPSETVIAASSLLPPA